MDIDRSDVGLLLSALAARYADVESTKKSLSEGGREHNHVYGDHPSNKKLNMHGVLAGVGTVAGAAIMPPEIRRPFLGAITGMELALAHQNRKGKQYKHFGAAMKKPIIAGILAGLLTHAAMGEDSGITFNADNKSIALGYNKKF